MRLAVALAVAAALLAVPTAGAKSLTKLRPTSITASPSLVRKRVKPAP